MTEKQPDLTPAEIAETAKKVIANAAKAKILLSVEAYHVWFEYFLGHNSSLAKDIEQIAATGVAFSPAINKKLHTKYFPQQQQQDAQLMSEVQRETQAMIESMVSELLKANKDTSQFGDRLEQYSTKLKTATKMSDIQLIMKAMLQDTTAQAASSRQLESKLKEASAQTEALRNKLHETEKEAYIDGLTGLNNRKAFDKKIAALFDEFRKAKYYFSVIFIDIDFFKKFNDTFGHKVGDLVLQIVGATLHKGVKGSDFPARYGGEEFVVLLPATTLDNARIVAEQLRVQIMLKKPTHPETGEVYSKITASMGVSQIKPEDTVETVVERADKALYLAKQSGRNNVKTEMELPS